MPGEGHISPYIYDHGTDPPKIMSYGADGAPGGKLFNADLSNLTLSQPIPESPYEVGRHLIDIAIWIAALFVFCASVYALARFSQLR
jgi:hypothetical protein